MFKDWWDSQDLAYETIPFDGRSDYDAFTLAGIPAGGIFAGAEEIKQPYQVALYGGTAGEAFDPCYHQLCDTLANQNLQGLEEHKDAAIHAIGTFAQTTSLGPRHQQALVDRDEGVGLEGRQPGPLATLRQDQAVQRRPGPGRGAARLRPFPGNSQPALSDPRAYDATVEP